MRRFGQLVGRTTAMARCRFEMSSAPSFRFITNQSDGGARAPNGTAPASSTSSRPPSEAEIDRIVAELEADGALLEDVMERMHPDHRRRLVIAGGALEWFGKDSVAREVSAADLDKDRVISPKDFDTWFESALKRRADTSAAHSTSPPTAKAADSSDNQVGNGGGKPVSGSSDADVPFTSLLLIAVEAGLPFVGFGFLDNATMILAGDAIDRTVGFYLHCSVLASAAMGNVVSGMMGMQVHGGVEKLIQRLNLPTPVLTEEQRRGQRVFLAGHIGGTVGIAIGLTLGMSLLLFTHDEEEKVEAIVFSKLDVEGKGSVSVKQIQGALREMGLKVEDAVVDELVRKFADSGKTTLSLPQFKQLCHELKTKVSL